LRSKAGRSVVGSLAASAGLQLIVIVSGVLVAWSLGSQDRGYLALLIVVSGVCALAGTLGLPAAVTYYIARDPTDARRITSSLAWVGALQLAGVFVVQAAGLAALVHSDPPRVQVAAAISLLLPPGILALSFGVAILQGQRRFTAFNLLRILPSTAYVAGVVIVYCGGRWVPRSGGGGTTGQSDRTLRAPHWRERWRAESARAHESAKSRVSSNPRVAGSNPARRNRESPRNRGLSIVRPGYALRQVAT